MARDRWGGFRVHAVHFNRLFYACNANQPQCFVFFVSCTLRGRTSCLRDWCYRARLHFDAPTPAATYTRTHEFLWDVRLGLPACARSATSRSKMERRLDSDLALRVCVSTQHVCGRALISSQTVVRVSLILRLGYAFRARGG